MREIVTFAGEGCSSVDILLGDVWLTLLLRATSMYVRSIAFGGVWGMCLLVAVASAFVWEINYDLTFLLWLENQFTR